MELSNSVDNTIDNTIDSEQTNRNPELIKQAREWLSPSDVNFVIYHSPCTDGTASMFAARLLLGNKAEYFKARYGGQSPPFKQIEGKNVCIVDFSYKRDVLMKVIETANKVIILDHHISAKEDLDGIQGAFFDMHQSGATLAWQYFHDEPIPYFIRLVEDNDIWTHKLNGYKGFAAWINNRPHEYEEYIKYIDYNNLESAITDGNVISTNNDFVLQRYLNSSQKCKMVTPDGLTYSARIINFGYLQSELGNLMALDSQVAIVWYYEHSSNLIKISLRSDKEYPEYADCSKISSQFGGGGHKHAAGFEMKSFDEFFSLIC